MRRLIYSVATSLDGFIAGPNGEYDWITFDSSYDFAALYRRFDTLLMGRRTYEVAKTRPAALSGMGMKVCVVSTTLDPAQNPDIAIIRDRVSEIVAGLKAESGKDIWLMGGGVLFRFLLDAGLVDGIDIAVMPVLLGRGVPFLPGGQRCTLRLNESKSLPSGILSLSYSVARL